jgi:hypothetical protein
LLSRAYALLPIRVHSERQSDVFRGREAHGRSIIKAISWRMTGSLDTFVISWIITGRTALAGSIAAT